LVEPGEFLALPGAAEDGTHLKPLSAAISSSDRLKSKTSRFWIK
jgi:hypothetical protein